MGCLCQCSDMQRCGYKNILGVLNRFLARTPKPVTSLYQEYALEGLDAFTEKKL